jgi:alpha-1,2-mannosyltransferase
MPTQTTKSPGTVTARLLRALIALSLACAFGIFAFAAAMGFTGSKLVAVIVAVGIAAFVAWYFWRRPIVPLDEGANSRALNVISGLATLAALFQLLRLCVFIVNPAEVGCTVSPRAGLDSRPNTPACPLTTWRLDR